MKKASSPEQGSSFWSRLYFRWVGPTLRRGMRTPLDLASLLPLNMAEEPERVDREFRERLAANRGQRRPVLRSLWQLHSGAFRRVFALSMLYLAASVSSPLLMRRLLQSIGGASGGAAAYAWAATLFVTALTTSMTAHHMFHVLLKLMVRVRVALVMTIYRKAMALTLHSRQAAPPGQIINLMGTDAQKFVNSLNVIHSVWMHPLQLVLVLAALYWILGPAALVGAALLLTFLLFSTRVARRQMHARRELVRHGDERVGLMNEILMSVRVIKFYAWERSFVGDVQAIRAKEVVQLQKLARLAAVGTLIFLSAPVVVAVVTFGAYVLSGHALNAADVFSSMALFAVLRQAMVMLPDVVTTCLEANVAAQRIEVFLELPELAPLAAAGAPGVPAGAVWARGAHCDWTPGKPALRGLDLTVAPGELVCVVGPVGCGKSALMAALLGDLEVTAGSIGVGGRLAYVSQQAWILSGTIRANVLFGEPFAADRYRQALTASCLTKDLGLFPQGDATEIGERGVNLSGGQRQRISLARAIYQASDVVLLDDPLSALDNQVGQAVFELAVLGALRGRTRILATHRLEYVAGADRILVLEDGGVAQAGTAAELLAVPGPFRELWRAYQRGGGAVPGAGAAAAAEPEAALVLTDVQASGPRLMTEEERNTGTVALSVYAMYFATFAPGLLTLALGAVFVAKEVLNAGSDSWLAYWSAAQPFEAAAFLGGFLALGLLACCSTFGRSLLIQLRGVVAGSSFHTRILESVMKAPMSFFERTPVGRILNRFSRDMEAIDQQIPRSLHEALGCVFNIATTLAMIIVATPTALVALGPIAAVYWQIQRHYRPTAREGQRLDSITRSPIFALYAESLSGVQVLRAYGAGPRVERELLGHLETNSRTFYTIVSANRWLGVRIESLGACVVAAAAFAAAAHTSAHGTGFVGLAITYALAITGAMNWAVRMFSQLESNLNSVERVEHYAKLPAERWPGAAPPPAWPARGHIVFEGLTLTYRPGLPPVLSDICGEILPGEKVGVVGRTGAGKSTLLLGLYRVLEPAAGRIVVDGVDLATLALAELRSAFAIIPQEPVLFRGSIRKNLDPFARRTDAELWDALARAELRPTVARQAAGLDAEVEGGGTNFSVGQRQLLCLARALLRRSRVLLMDEATASVDVATDVLIQRTIRTEFAAATVITIAHRLSTVMDYDRIMVLDGGRLVGFDAPWRLAADRCGPFAALLREERPPQGVLVPG